MQEIETRKKIVLMKKCFSASKIRFVVYIRALILVAGNICGEVCLYCFLLIFNGKCIYLFINNTQ